MCPFYLFVPVSPDSVDPVDQGAPPACRSFFLAASPLPTGIVNCLIDKITAASYMHRISLTLPRFPSADVTPTPALLHEIGGPLWKPALAVPISRSCASYRAQIRKLPAIYLRGKVPPHSPLRSRRRSFIFVASGSTSVALCHRQMVCHLQAFVSNSSEHTNPDCSLKRSEHPHIILQPRIHRIGLTIFNIRIFVRSPRILTASSKNSPESSIANTYPKVRDKQLSHPITQGTCSRSRSSYLRSGRRC